MEFVRTINTADAYKIKMEHLEKELRSKENELKDYEDVGLGTEVGGGFFRLIGSLANIIGWILILLGFIGVIMDGVEESINNFTIMFAVFFVGIFFILLGLFWKGKSKKLFLKASDKERRVKSKKKLL